MSEQLRKKMIYKCEIAVPSYYVTPQILGEGVEHRGMVTDRKVHTVFIQFFRFKEIPNVCSIGLFKNWGFRSLDASVSRG